MPVLKKPNDRFFGLINDEKIDKVLNEYDIRSWSVIPFFSLNKSILDLNKRTDTCKKVLLKSDDKIYLLKKFPWYRSEKYFVKEEIEFCRHLKSKGIPTPRIYSNVNGKYYTRLSDNEYFVLYEYVDGESWHKYPEESERSAEFLAQLHKICATYSPESDNKLEENVFDSAIKMLDLVKDKFSQEEHHRKILDKYISENKSRINKLKSVSQSKGYFEFSIPIHGDFNPFNIIYSKEGDIVSILDFNNFCVDNPVHDFAEGLIRFSYLKFGELTSVYIDVPDKFNKEHFHLFHNSYKSGNLDFYDRFKNYLPEVLEVLAIEFSALGLLCEYYSVGDVDKIIKSLDDFPEYLDNIIGE